MITTKAAARWLASAKTALTTESYLQLMTTAQDIARERKARRLSRTHVKLALQRMGAGQSQSS